LPPFPANQLHQIWRKTIEMTVSCHPCALFKPFLACFSLFRHNGRARPRKSGLAPGKGFLPVAPGPLPGQQRLIKWVADVPVRAITVKASFPILHDQPPEMSIAGCYKREGRIPLRVGTSFSALLFPPLDM
jgi:hypothetical protein